MGLYCLKCGVWAYKTHKCDVMSLVPLTSECIGLANKMYALGFDLLSAGCFITPVAESLYDHRINFDIELRHPYPLSILDFPAGWEYYTEIVGTDLQVAAIGYSETYTVTSTHSPSERAQCVARTLEGYLSTLNAEALKAIKTLYNTGL